MASADGEGPDRLRFGGWVRELEVSQSEGASDLIGPPLERPNPDSGLTGTGLGQEEPELGSDPYRGGHRRESDLLSRLSPNQLRVAVIAGMVTLAVAIAVPVLTGRGSDPGGATSANPMDLPVDGEDPVFVPGPEATPSGLSATASAGASPTNTPSPTPPVALTTAGGSGPTIAPPTTPPPPPGPVTYQAETAIRSGSADLERPTCSRSRRVVRGIGDWTEPPGPGVLTFTDIAAPAAGAYQMTAYYLNSNDPDRTAVIKVNGDGGQSVSGFTAVDCVATRTVTVTLTAGANSIEFSNPTNRAPNIDYIVISAAG